MDSNQEGVEKPYLYSSPSPEGEANEVAQVIHNLAVLLDKHLFAGHWGDAMATALKILKDVDARTILPGLLVRRAARIFAEIALVLDLGQENDSRVTVEVISSLVFSVVPADEWLGTQGVAAAMLTQKSSAVGNVDFSYATGKPLLIASDQECRACHLQFAERTHRACAGKCQGAYYCCPEHQKYDWPRHQAYCGGYKRRLNEWWADSTQWKAHYTALYAQASKRMVELAQRAEAQRAEAQRAEAQAAETEKE